MRPTIEDREEKKAPYTLTEHVLPAAFVAAAAAAAAAVSCPIASLVIAGPFPNCAASRC